MGEGIDSISLNPLLHAAQLLDIGAIEAMRSALRRDYVGRGPLTNLIHEEAPRCS